MLDNTLSLKITNSYTLNSFNIVNILVVPNKSATINITISSSDCRLHDRTVFIDGDAYIAWTTDDYLYTYIQNNITTIFG